MPEIAYLENQHEVSKENNLMLYDTLEEEYRTAGWIGGIEIMRLIASSPHISLPSNGRPSEDTCLIKYCKKIINKKPREAILRIENWLSTPKKYDIELTMAKHVGMLERVDNNKYKIPTCFSDAIDITFSNDAKLHDILEETNFVRHLYHVDKLVGYYFSKLVSAGESGTPLTMTLCEIVRDIDFYVGHYDPNKDSR